MRTQLVFAFLLPMTMLASCEGVVHYSGNVYDQQTKKPVAGVKIGWRIYNSETWNIRTEYDTLSVEDRKRLRKQGTKDDYTFLAGAPLDDTTRRTIQWTNRKADTRTSYYYGRYQMQHCIECYSDANGKFLSGPRLLSYAFGPPRISLVFCKEGYDTLYVAADCRPPYDGLQVFMTRRN